MFELGDVPYSMDGDGKGRSLMIDIFVASK
jgi:hypothetical protein